METIIRYASENDENLLIEMYIREIENDELRAQQFAKDLINKHRTILCLYEDDLLGTISWDTRGQINDGLVEINILSIGFDPKKRGIAKELMMTLINDAKRFFSKKGYKLRVIYFFMEKSDEIARSFYKHMGFREVSEIPSFYPDENAIMWIKYF